MPFIPSLLEYNPQNLKKRLELVTNYSDIFENIQKANDQKIHLHLDFVLPEFAKKRQVQHGILPQETIESINNHFEDDDSLVLNMHFMGSEKDLTDSLNYLKTLKFKKGWTYLLHTNTTQFNKWEKSFNDVDNVKIGIWLDLDEWDEKTIFKESAYYLLMTVKAGKSGQKLELETNHKVMNIVKSNPIANFTIDGGWNVQADLLPNLSIVSYSKFWQEFDKVANI